jgi:xanthine/CO dehydrogenase XdhC/CoxF family maturation factor
METTDTSELAQLASAFLDAPDQALAMLCLVSKSGSSYRRAGARMLLRKDGSYFGGISAGCLEADLIERVRRLQAQGRAFEYLEVDTRPLYGCDGRIGIFIELIPHALTRWQRLMEQLMDHLRSRTPACWITRYGPACDETSGTWWLAPGTPAPENNTQWIRVQTIEPLPRLIVVGAHRDVQPLLLGAQNLGWHWVQIIPGNQSATWQAEATGPWQQVLQLDPDTLAARFPPDPATAVVLMTHHLGRDAAFARALLPQAYPYIGLLGSRKRRDEVLHAVIESCPASDGDAFDSLRSPIGLDLGANTAAGIALSILAEVQATLNARSALPLSKAGTTNAVQLAKASQPCSLNL